MEGRRQPDEDGYCRVGSVKWLEDRGEQDDREMGVTEEKSQERKW